MILVGVDAGGTGSRAVVVDGGVVVERRDLGPINVLLHADALDRLAGVVTDTGASAAGFGLAGLRSGEHAREIAAELEARTGARIAVGDDTDAALAGAFEGKPGIVVIAGTGSGAAGRDAAGRTVRVGGHGYLLGDEGGGYWIGREAVRAAMRGADGTGPPTALTAMVQRAFDSLTGAEQQVHHRPTDRGLLARLVPAVAAAAAGRYPATADPTAADPTGGHPTGAAPGPTGGHSTGAAVDPAAAGGPTGDAPGPARGPTDRGPTDRGPTDRGPTDRGPTGDAGRPIGDAEARRILGEAAAHLIDLAEAVRAKLGPLPVAGVGGIFRCAPVRDAFRAGTGATEPAEAPELGALRLLDR